MSSINTSNNQRLGSVFNYLDPRLSLRLCKKSAGMSDVRPKIHPAIESTLSHTISNQIRIRSAFFLRQMQLVKFALVFCDWLILVAFSQPMGSQKNCDLLAHVFPHLELVTSI